MSLFSYAGAKDKGLELDLVVVSPLTRAIETARLGLADAWKDENVPFVAMEWCREHYGKNTPDRRLTG
jgi:phosphohistidine phosphatase SixA